VKTPPGALQIAFRPNLSPEVEERSWGRAAGGQSLIGISASKPPANHDPAMRRIVGGKAVDGNVTSPDPNKRGVRSVFQVAIVRGRKPSSNLTNPFG
jgi:hypothetical protein